MKTEVAILHKDYPTEIRDRVEDKLQHLVKYFDRVKSIRALLERQSEEHRVEIVSNCGRGTVLVADVNDEAFSSALDKAIARMTSQLKKHHDKVTKDRHRGGRVGH
jgi:ribosomal subunit interface protein